MAFESHVSRWRTALLVAGSAGFVAAGLWLVGLFGPPPATGLGAQIAGWVGIVFFGLCGIAWGRRLFQSGLEMRIDGNGVYWRRWSNQTIPWNAVERIALNRIRNQRFVCLVVKDPRAFPSTTLLGKVAGANKAMGFGDIALSAVGSDRSFADMLAAIKRFAPGF